MFKKFCIFMAAVFTMLISCAGPIMTRVHAADDFPSTLEALKIKNESPSIVDNCHYAFANTYSTVNNEVKTGAILVRLNDIHLNDIYCEYSNNIFILRSNNGDPLFDFFVFYDSWAFHSYTRSASAVQFDFNDNVVYALDSDLNYISLFGYDSNITSCQFGNFDTNFEEFLQDDFNVEVSFSPTLSGDVDRYVNSSEGSFYRSNLVMRVKNQSPFGIQYDMRIMKKNINSVRGGYSDLSEGGSLGSNAATQFDDDPVFIYYSSDWVYGTNHDDMNSMLNSDGVKENKGTPWHYVAANSTDIVNFDFSQINLDEGEEYICTVRAVRNDYNIASELVVYLASSDPAYSELHQIQGDDLVTVWNSEFTMLNYSDVKYDPNNSSNGVLPYNGKNGIVDKQTYTYGRNARENADGTIDYKSVNQFTDKNSWLNKQYNDVIVNHQNNITSSNSSGYASLNAVFTPCLRFLNGMYGLYPSNYQLIFTVGFSCIALIGIMKAVFK